MCGFEVSNPMKYKVAILIGLFLLFSGVLYEFFFIGLPYQDPTPEIVEKVLRQQKIKSLFYYTASVVLGATAIHWLVSRMKR